MTFCAARKRGQGATEYLVVLGAVLLVSIVTVNILSSPAPTASIKEQQSSAYWQSASPFSIKSYSLGPGSFAVTVKNQLSKQLRLTKVEVSTGGASGSSFSVFSGALVFASSEEKTLFLPYGVSNPCKSVSAGKEYELSTVTFTYDESAGIIGVKQVSTTGLVGRCSTTGIVFVPPTPDDGSSVSAGSSITLNATVSGVSLASLGWRWNNTDYSFYDNSLLLMMDFNDNSALGESESVAIDTSLNAASGSIYGASYVDGEYGKAVEFSRGGTINFSSAASAQLSPSGQLSVEAWVKNGAAYSIRNISVGFTNTCVVLANGSVMCWGDNIYGQLGIGNTTNMYSSVFVHGITAASVSFGWDHACALLSNGSALCWGANGYGQLGIGNTTNMYSPVFVPGLNTTVISAGKYHTCAVLSNGSGACWGNNDYGELGIGNDATTYSPTLVHNLANATIIEAGTYHTCALLANHSAMCWGLNNYGELGIGNTVDKSSPVFVNGITTATAISEGDAHTCALLSNRSIMCWGLNSEGALGIGNTTNMYSPVFVPGVTTATAISTGVHYTCALLSNGSVMCWGLNSYGQLGIGNYTNMYSPVLVPGINATAISSGDFNACALLVNGSVMCWGRGDSLALGNAAAYFQTTPVLLEGSFSGSASCSWEHCCMLLSSGSVACSGYGAYGALGNGNTESVSLPTIVSGLSEVSSVSTTYLDSSYALLANGSVASWGDNTYGQLGDGTAETRLTPVLVRGLSNVQSISQGGISGGASCAVLTNGSVACWGYGGDGALGIGNTTNMYFPVFVNGITTATAVSAGYTHSCALLLNQSVMCWGHNGYGALGIGNDTDMYSPVFVPGITTATAILAGWESTFALLANGSILSWGDNEYAELGIGNDTTMYSPVFVPGITSATAISTADAYTCALLSNGSVMCWGYNDYGELGIGNTTWMYSPVLVPGLTNIVAISSGTDTTFALDRSEKTYGWGNNAYGLLGIGVAALSDALTPMPIFDGVAAGRSGNSWSVYYVFGDNRDVYGSVNTVSVAGNLFSGWNHVVMTYDRSLLKLYVNGVLASQRALTVPIFNDGGFQIGTGSNSTVDGLRVYNRALSAAEVAQHYNSELRKTGANSWLFTSNQNLLPAGAYSYFVNATVANGGQVYSEERSITVS